MKTSVLLLVGVALLAIANSDRVREKRQVWNSANGWGRPSTTTRRTTIRTRITPTTPAARRGSTSTRPPGVIFQIQNCPCPAPPQYNPVCGTDGNTYVNRQKLACARRCGFDVQEARMGAC